MPNRRYGQFMVFIVSHDLLNKYIHTGNTNKPV